MQHQKTLSKIWHEKWKSTPMTLGWLPQKGRFLMANRDIRAGEIVLEEEAQFFGYNEKLCQNVCDMCGKYDLSQALPVECSKCKQVYFCSKECHSKANSSYHVYECVFLSELKKEWKQQTQKASQEFELLMLTTRMLVIFLLHQHTKKKQMSIETQQWLQGKHQMFEFEELAFDPPLHHDRTSEAAASIVFRAASKANQIARLSPDLPKKKTIRLWILRTFVNRFSFYFPPCPEVIEEIEDFESPDDLVFGEGVFPFASFFNHSCTPNLAKLRHFRTLKFVALFDIPKGAELTHSYTSGNIPFKERQNGLKLNWNFVCDCMNFKIGSGCCDESYYQKYMKAFQCLGDEALEDCSGWYVMYHPTLGRTEERHCSFFQHRCKDFPDEFTPLHTIPREPE